MNKNLNSKNQKSNIKGQMFAFFFGKERDFFIENLSLLVSSGLPILSALSAIRSEVRSKKMRDIISQIFSEVEDGAPLSRALDHSHIFPEHVVSLAKIGEESGKLIDNLKVIRAQQEKERNFRSKIRSAMLYPIFVFSLSIIVGVGIAWFILPKLAIVFAQLHINLPILTRILIAFGMFLGDWGFLVVPLFIIFLLASIYLIFYFPKTKFIGQSILYLIPGVNSLMKEVELTRFGYLLGTLLQAGLSITRALLSVEESTLLFRYRNLYQYLRESVDEGNSFQKSFLSFKKIRALIPVPVQQLIVAGEQSGNLSETFLKISQNFETKTETTTKNLTVILEPILLVIVWLGVLAVALSVILPIYSLIGNFPTS
ncbi:type II secretion system F family protein [Candidatus Uhrbacteria bacterium]|nr:type II secretion system F family protein [Candidatus Uhrbacteria bacterium]